MSVTSLWSVAEGRKWELNPLGGRQPPGRSRPLRSAKFTQALFYFFSIYIESVHSVISHMIVTKNSEIRNKCKKGGCNNKRIFWAN